MGKKTLVEHRCMRCGSPMKKEFKAVERGEDGKQLWYYKCMKESCGFGCVPECMKEAIPAFEIRRDRISKLIKKLAIEYVEIDKEIQKRREV